MSVYGMVCFYCCPVSLSVPFRKRGGAETYGKLELIPRNNKEEEEEKEQGQTWTE